MSDPTAPSVNRGSALTRAGQWIVYAVFRVFEFVLRVLPLAAVFTIGRWGGWFAWCVAGPYRRLVLSNLRIAYGREMDESSRRRLARRHFLHLGANLLSSLKLPTMPLAEIEKVIELDGMEHVEKGIRDDLGFIYAICHMGNWEALAQIPGVCPTGKPGTLYQPLSNPFLNAHIVRSRSRVGFRLFDRNDGFHATIQFVREGGGLGVLVDQHAGDSGIWCPLFRRLASTTPLGALLTLRTGGPVLPLGILTTGRARWRVLVRPPVEGTIGDIAALTAQLNLELEKLIRLSPADWFWVHNRWKTPKPNFLLARYKRGVEYPPGMSAVDLQPFEILVRTPNWLGDACMALPAVRALKAGRPDARLTVLTPAKLADFWRAVAEVDAVIEKDIGGPRDSILAVRRKIRATGRHYDVAVLLVDSPRSAFEVAGCGIPRLVGYRGRWRARLLNQIVPPPKPGPLRHHVHHFLRIAGHCGAALDDPRWRQPLRPRPPSPIDPARPPRLGLCAGAEYGPAKRWPADRFAAAACAVSAATGAQWTLLGTQADQELGKELAQHLGDTPHRNLIGQTTLATLMQTLQELDLLLTNDTGTMHLAATLGVPVVAIFGSTEPAWTGPAGPGHTVLRHHVPCSPCFHRECPLKRDRYRCFNAITAEMTAQAVLVSLAGQRATTATA
ncbi:MAG: lipopolysaccharide heptosyltransferase II [Verrucomicrobiales bacterium]